MKGQYVWAACGALLVLNTWNVQAQVQGSGTPGKAPLWTGSGDTLTDSHIEDNGGNVKVALPLFVMDSSGDAAVIASGGIGLLGQGNSVGIEGQGDTGVQANGTTYGVYASGGTALYGNGTGNASVGVYGQGDNRGVVGLANKIDGWGVTGENDNGGPGVKAIQHSVSSGFFSGGAVDSFSDGDGVQAWGQATGMLGVSDSIGVLGQIRDANTPITPPTVPAVIPRYPATSVGIVGNCIRPSSSGCMGIYGYANAGSGFAHGIVGETDFGPDGAGVIGITHSTGQGVRGSTDNRNGVGVNGVNSAGGLAGAFTGDVGISGNLIVTGTKSSLAKLGDGRVVALYAVESPENWFEDFGTARLRNGAVAIPLDATFTGTVNAGVEYHVFLTPTGNCRGLYVAQKTPTTFEVRELRGGKSNTAFDYRIVARRRGFETVRLKEVPANGNIALK